MAYYGFQKEKNIDKSIIDWSSITKKISDDLISTGEDRQKQRNELEDTQVKNINTIKNYVTGEDTDMNSFVLEQSQSTRGFLSAIHKQMTSGKISVDKAKRIKQRVMNSWGSVSEASKTFQANAKRLGDSKGKANEALLNIMGLNADLNNKQIYHDPETGEGYYVDVDKKTGEVDLSTAKPISAINNVQRQTKQYVDVPAETSAIAKKAPKIKLAINSTTDISSALQSKAYTDYLDNAVNAKLSDDERMVSVGLDFLDMEYTVDGEGSSDTTITYDKVTGFNRDGTPIYKKEEVSIGKINFNSSTGKAELTPEQRKVIKDGYKNAIIGQLPRETSKQYVDTRASTTGASRKTQNKSLFELSNGIARGYEKEIKQLKGQKYTATEDNKKVYYTLAEPIVTEQYIQFKADDGTDIAIINKFNDDGERIPDENVALQVAQIIRSGEPADKVQGSYDEGKNLYGGVYKPSGGKTAITATESYLDTIPVDETQARKHLQEAYKGDKRISFEESNWGEDEITIIIETRGKEEKEAFKTTDIAGIKKYLKSYGFDDKTRLKGDSAFAEKVKIDQFGNIIE